MTYAEVSDIESRWHELSSEEQSRAEVLLEDASAYIDSQVDAGSVEPEKLKIVACNLVIRMMSNMDSNASGATQASITAGPYTQSWTWPNQSNFFLTKADRILLGIRKGYIGSIRPMIGGRHDNWHHN